MRPVPMPSSRTEEPKRTMVATVPSTSVASAYHSS